MLDVVDKAWIKLICVCCAYVDVREGEDRDQQNCRQSVRQSCITVGRAGWSVGSVI